MGNFLLLTFCGTFIYSVCAGFRDNYGLLLPYISRDIGIDYASISFIIGLGQLFFGLMQPVFGYVSIRKSPRFVLLIGSLMVVSGLILIPLCHNFWSLVFTMGVLLPSGTGAASFGIIMSCLIPVFSERQIQISSGIVAAGIGFGICLLSPIIQHGANLNGISGALLVLAFPVVMLLPMSFILGSGNFHGNDSHLKKSKNKPDLKNIIITALKCSTYRRVTFGFFTCGFHMALIQTHLFSQLISFGIPDDLAAWCLSIYGLGTAIGAFGSGIAAMHFAFAKILGCLYFSRCIWVIVLLLQPDHVFMFTAIFLLGLTGVATLSPTSGLINRTFGTLQLATLFGITYFLHQIGAFCSAWLGGICFRLTQSYLAIWGIDIILCLWAGLVCFTINERELAESEGT